MFKPFPYPGRIPDKPPPQSGEDVVIYVTGLPPYKDVSKSIRNPKHPYYDRFTKLREAASNVMDGRSWLDGAVTLEMKIYYIQLDPQMTPNDYLGGVMDTLDGSHGPNFTYLPIIYNDDCQVWNSTVELIQSKENKYDLKIRFD